MAWIPRMRARLRRQGLAKELDQKTEIGLTRREQVKVEREMPPAEVRRSFGDLSLWREWMSEIDPMLLLQTVLQDVRYGARMLWRNAGFTLVAVVALAIGIGVNTAAFTAYKAFFGRSLDARDPETMANLAVVLHSGVTRGWFSYPDYEAYRDHLHSFSGLIAGKGMESLTLSGAGGIVSQHDSAADSLAGRLGLLPPSAGNAEFASTYFVSENYFSVLGVKALRGRTFEAGDTAELAASPAALISENYWVKRFGGDPVLLGKTVRLNGAAFTIIGITPHNFVGTTVGAPDFWLPLSLEPLVHGDNSWLHERENLCCRLFGRLAPGVGMGKAQAEMDLLGDYVRTLHDPATEWAKPAMALVWPGSPFPFPIRQHAALKFALVLIMAAVGLVLVVACANVASLQLARAAARQNELGMRLSLGASRMRLVRQLLTESALLGLLAGAVAFLFTWVLLRIAVTVAGQAFPADYGTLIFHVNPDLEIFAYVFGVSLAAGVLFGLAPALESSRSALKANAVTSPMRSRRMRDFLIAAQVAITLALMIAGSMSIRSAMHTLDMDTGYDGKHVVDLELQFPAGTSYSADRKAAVVRELRTRLAVLPGVAAITSARAPDGGGLRVAAISLNREKPTAQNARTFLYYTYVQANYFETLGIPLLSGRGFQKPSGQPEPSVILSESAARQLWPGQNPIGRSLSLGTDAQDHEKNELLPDGQAYQVIGVARDTRGIQLDLSDQEQVYLPLPDDRLQEHPLLIRTQRDPAQVMRAIGPVISQVDPNLVATSSTLDEMLRQTNPFISASLAAGIASAVGLLGLLLASMGIYGTVSYIVALRTREVGIRMALGAKRRDILALMLRESIRPVLAGLLAGMILAAGATHLLRGILFGLGTVDVLSFTGVSLLFLAIALLASWLPSRRAMRVDPMVALRYE